MTGWLMNMEQSMEWELAGGTEVLKVNLPCCRCVRHNSHKTWPGIKLWQPQWEARNCLRLVTACVVNLWLLLWDSSLNWENVCSISHDTSLGYNITNPYIIFRFSESAWSSPSTTHEIEIVQTKGIQNKIIISHKAFIIYIYGLHHYKGKLPKFSS
jgi:hypothetical protein